MGKQRKRTAKLAEYLSKELGRTWWADIISLTDADMDIQINGIDKTAVVFVGQREPGAADRIHSGFQ